jgi:catalase
MAKKQLTEQQQKFIEVLFAEAKGDPVRAKKLAGYSDNSPTRDIMNSIKEEIISATQMYVAFNAPRAAMAVVDGIMDPTELGIKEKLNAAKDLLDRAGVVKTEKMHIESSSGIMILPPKRVESMDE